MKSLEFWLLSSKFWPFYSNIDVFIHWFPGELVAHCMGQYKEAYCELFDHRDGTFTLNVQPQEPGRHELHIKYDGEHVTGK